ncbi:hypothetical protein [Telmatospirillum sp.]|uniref:hypothetical protein n=1 Tax=Telmatospirillum sp. TaxID=2079197 RepID=UPI00284AE792|nr:hypothetical protein [Telmatospirillum sp.]MDR3440957.1 hypothetical protein [Telmatospirillum sp.]
MGNNRQGIHLSNADSCPNKPGHLNLRNFRPDYSVDIPTLAVGGFILTFKFILERAVMLQEDVDLTI